MIRLVLPRSRFGRAVWGARLALGTVAIGRIVRTARRVPPVRATDGAPGDVPSTRVPSISVVVPARDEAGRIGPLLDRVIGAPGVTEVIVVDDASRDATAEIAAAAGARVVTGAPLPVGWAGKAWALQQGIEEASGEWVVTLDADTRPEPSLPSAAVVRAAADDLDLLTLGGRFECPTVGVRWLHPAMLTTLVYRFGAPGSVRPPRPGRELANGQCMVVPRRAFLDRGGLAPVAAEVVEDVALARRISLDGGRVAMLDGSEVLTTRMYEDLGDAWRGWARSLALPGVEPLGRQVGELAVVTVAQALPLPCLAAGLCRRRVDPLDVVLAAVRLGTLVGTSRSYRRRGLAYWASPLADGPALVALVRGVVRRRVHVWRGRIYG